MIKQIGALFIFFGLVFTTIFFTGLFFSPFVFSEEEEEPSSPPDSEVHLFDLSYQNERYLLSNGANISNNVGYDNQPYFAADSKTLLYVSVRDGKQTDVYEYNIKDKKSLQITDTPHSEYSPKYSHEPSDNNNLVSFVSEGGNPYQSVWQLNRKLGESKWLFNSKEPVGYYQVNHKSGDVLFWSRYGWSVQYLNLKRNESRFVSGNALPSSPMQIPNSNSFSFVHRQTNSEVWIKSFNPADFSITPIAPVYGSNNDYTWAPNGDLFRVEKNILYVWTSEQKIHGWKKMQDLSKQLEGNISRLAISSDGKKIALVVNQ